LDRFIGIHEREKSKVAVGSRVDEDIHIGIGFGFVARMRSEQVKPLPPRDPAMRVQCSSILQ
jgi:hypothetical protein